MTASLSPWLGECLSPWLGERLGPLLTPRQGHRFGSIDVNARTALRTVMRLVVDAPSPDAYSRNHKAIRHKIEPVN